MRRRIGLVLVFVIAFITAHDALLPTIHVPDPSRVHSASPLLSAHANKQNTHLLQVHHLCHFEALIPQTPPVAQERLTLMPTGNLSVLIDLYRQTPFLKPPIV